MKLWMVAPIAAAGIALVIVVSSLSFEQATPSNLTTSSAEEQTRNPPPPLIPVEKIVGGGVPRDGIPSIDNPRFVRTGDASFLQDGDIVVGLRHAGVTKAYPLQILVWHEIVNDEIAGKPVAVTYCPLCFTIMVYDRVIEGQEVEFGTSGKLYNSNLVMYDRLSESYWSQGMSKGIVGRYSGHDLEKLPFDVAYWRDWKALYPETLVLSTDTGSARPYGTDPYGNYYTSPEIFFPVEHRDERLGPKVLVMGLEDGGNFKAYRLDDIARERVLNDSVSGKKILLISAGDFTARAYESTVGGEVLEFYTDGDDGKLLDRQTGSEWNFEGRAVSGPLEGEQLTRLVLESSFWFSWAAFHPATEIYTAN